MRCISVHSGPGWTLLGWAKVNGGVASVDDFLCGEEIFESQST
jgi:hypothetical protein